METVTTPTFAQTLRNLVPGTVLGRIFALCDFEVAHDLA